MKALEKREYPVPLNRLRCRLCGGKDHKVFAEKGPVKYALCSGCGILRQHPYPSQAEIHSFYSGYLATKHAKDPQYLSDGYFTQFANEKNLTLADLKFNLKQHNGSLLLDVGCATGQLMNYARSFGINAEGIDVSDELIRICRAGGLNASTKTLSDLKNEKKRFDIITAFHVIEHVPDPSQMIREIHGLLNQGGFLLMETPRFGAIAEAFGADWRFLMPTEHLHLFSKEVLFKFLGDAGFSIISWISFGSGNDSGTVPPVNKRAMDRVAKQLGIGDTLALCARKSS